MELIITVLALLVTVYAVIPRVRQLDLRLRIDWLDWVVITAGFVFVLSLEFRDFRLAHGWALIAKPLPTGITPKNLMYLALLAVTAFVALRIRFSRLTKRKIHRFRELVEELYWAGSYGELFTLVQRHLDELFRIYDSEFLFSRIRRTLKGLILPNLSDLLKVLDEIRDMDALPMVATAVRPRRRGLSARVRSLLRPMAPAIVRLLPEYDSAQEAAKEIVRGVFLAPRFLEALARTRPYLGLDIISKSKAAFERFDFVEQFMKELIREPQSILYWEIYNNQNTSQDRYFIPDSNRVLSFFLSDIKVAQDNRVYKPVGDFILSHLDDLGREPESDPYNRMYGDFEKVGAWHSPVFVGVRFFDIMVKEALFQGMQWHMWLYYMPPIVEKIVRNYRISDPLADENSEIPIRYSCLLYQIFSCLRDWISALEDVPTAQANVVLNSTRADHENGNIPKSSILALSDCAYYVAVSQHVGSRLKNTLLNMVFELYFDLRSSGKFDNYATVLLTAISKYKSYRRDQAQYHEVIAAAFEEEQSEYLIKHPEQHVSELEAALTT